MKGKDPKVCFWYQRFIQQQMVILKPKF